MEKAFSSVAFGKVCMIVGACAVLHNIALQLHEPMEDGEVDELADVGCLPFTRKIRKFRMECKW